ncbi:hypothetical protein [Actinophytocola sp.]|uniref:hypothetical protein n=1 Tax=Actinophytocola sp. TaxID=1872138 RepID=UPI002D802CC7|nr:hypothetical protein [Actinophytocola sp.]HET9143873.1 hypothetical protein [Actinophytocola sp.]
MNSYLSRADLAPAHHLRRAGQWDIALSLVPGRDPAAAALRAEILVERHLWRLDPPDAAVAACAEVDDPALANLLRAQLEYWRRLFRLGGSEVTADPVTEFGALRDHPEHGGWATFWHAISTEQLLGDGDTAAAGYRRARERADATGDRFLESYAVRHQGDQLINRAGDRDGGIALLRRSLQLRAAEGARPQVAAAQVALAGELPPGAEADELRDIGRSIARELGIPWLGD